MAEHSPIEWTHNTFSPWQGCTKVSTGCKHCYAETHDRRRLHASYGHWGANAPRLFMSDRYMRQPLAWNRTAKRKRQRARVFCMSMGDLFEVHGIPHIAKQQVEYRARVFELIEQTPWLDWLLLTKRPVHFELLLPASWRARPRHNVWLGVSIENQETATARLPLLLDTPAVVHFISYEPALGPLDLEAAAPRHCIPLQLHWLIAGCESGNGRRPAKLAWIRDARDQCQRLGVHFFFKQWAEGRRKVSLPVLDGRKWCELPARSDAT